MRALGIVVMVVVALLMVSGCASISPADRQMYRQVEQSGLDVKSYRVVNGWIAGPLNILPGIGNFYLGAEGGEAPQYLYGTLNLVVWPAWILGIIWRVPEAAIDAGVINQRAVVEYYRENPKGKAAFAAAMESPSP